LLLIAASTPFREFSIRAPNATPSAPSAVTPITTRRPTGLPSTFPSLSMDQLHHRDL